MNVGLGTVEVAVPDRHVVTQGREGLLQHGSNGDGPMAAPGTADRNGQITPALLLIQRQKKTKERFEMVQKGFGIRVAPNIGLHARIFAGQFLEIGDKVRIQEKSYVEEEIDVVRHTEFEAERKQRER